MTNLVRYLTHPQVKIDPVIPVPSWGLSEVGRARTEAIASTGRLSGTTQIISSGELKAIEAAEIIAAKLNVNVEVREAMHENDRSATGFLMPDEFEAVANQFFARPHISIRGWERAIDAQLRIVREVEYVLARNGPGDVLFIGHGGVGTLLYCHYSGFAIDRNLRPTSWRWLLFRVHREGSSRAAFMASHRRLMILSRLRSTTEIPLSDAERRRLLRGKARLPGAEPRRCRAFPHEREKPAP